MDDEDYTYLDRAGRIVTPVPAPPAAPTDEQGQCFVCRFTPLADDREQEFRDGRVLCLRCYHRLAGDEPALTRDNRREIEDVLEQTAATDQAWLNQ